MCLTQFGGKPDLARLQSSDAGEMETMSERPLFRLPGDDGIPPFPGEELDRQAADLPSLLGVLLTAARCNIIDAPGKAPDDPSIVDEFGRLNQAALAFDVAPGVSLTDHFWTHGEPFRRGEVAARLRDSAHRSLEAVDGFLALYGTDVASPLLYGPNMMPFRVAQTIEAPEGVPGPFIALIVCRLASDGRVQALSGYAQPIVHGRRFVPVASELERDVLRALEQLQIALDAQGVDCAIERIAGEQHRGDSAAIELTISHENELIRKLRLSVQADDRGARNAETGFEITPATWADGSFVAWLEQAILN
jgi:hypothetical protein